VAPGARNALSSLETYDDFMKQRQSKWNSIYSVIDFNKTSGEKMTLKHLLEHHDKLVIKEQSFLKSLTKGKPLNKNL
jgi:hypothetical protein